MRRIFKTYFAPAYTSSIQNFYETNTYITRVSHDYEGKEERFAWIEAFWIWQSYEVENGLGKYIKSKYIGKIENMWIIEAYFDEKKDEFLLWSIETIIWENDLNNPYLSSKIKECLRNQHNAFHYESKLSWSKKIKWLFIQVKKVNAFENNVLYKQKEIQDIYTEFDENWGIINSEITKKYFKMHWNVFLDIEKKIFIKWDEQVIIKSDKHKQFIEYLIKSHPNNIEKERLIDYLFPNLLKNSHNNYTDINTKQLLPLKKGFIKSYKKIFCVDNEKFNEKVLSSGKYKWYLLKWKFIDELK